MSKGLAPSAFLELSKFLHLKNNISLSIKVLERQTKKEIFYELHLIGFLVSNFLKILKIELSAYGVKDKEKNKNLSGLFAKLEKDSKRQIEKGKIW